MSHCENCVWAPLVSSWCGARRLSAALPHSLCVGLRFVACSRVSALRLCCSRVCWVVRFFSPRAPFFVFVFHKMYPLLFPTGAPKGWTPDLTSCLSSAATCCPRKRQTVLQPLTLHLGAVEGNPSYKNTYVTEAVRSRASFCVCFRVNDQTNG